MKKKKIEYISQGGAPMSFVSSKLNVPDWYKKTSKTYDGELSLLKNNKTIKYCTPFLDALISGYMIETPCDIQVTKNGDYSALEFVKTDLPDPIGVRDAIIAENLPRGPEHTLDNFFWAVRTGFRTPKGYSILVTHPLNRIDLPFTTLSGIIDADQGIHGGKFPFFLKRDFEGIIPAGTPFAQMIPFKRDSWTSEKNEKLKDIVDLHAYKSLTRLFGYYKQQIWKRKEYE
jgi:hypothetical protein